MYLLLNLKAGQVNDFCNSVKSKVNTQFFLKLYEVKKSLFDTTLEYFFYQLKTNNHVIQYFPVIFVFCQ